MNFINFTTFIVRTAGTIDPVHRRLPSRSPRSSPPPNPGVERLLPSTLPKAGTVSSGGAARTLGHRGGERGAARSKGKPEHPGGACPSTGRQGQRREATLRQAEIETLDQGPVMSSAAGPRPTPSGRLIRMGIETLLTEFRIPPIGAEFVRICIGQKIPGSQFQARVLVKLDRLRAAR